jgi:uncharacterized coiled-coil DUF342 family protein
MKINQQWVFGKSEFTLQKENPETGWKQLRNQNATDFWIPDDVFTELTGGLYLKESVKEFRSQIVKQYNIIDEKKEEIKKLRASLDSKRKSVEYYKNHRDETREILNNVSKKLEAVKSLHEQELEYAISKTEQWKEQFSDLQETHEVCRKNLTKYILLLSSLLGISLICNAIF